MRKIICLLMLLSTICLSGCANISAMRADVQIKSAKKYLLSEDYEKAIVRLNRAIAMDPKNAEAYILLAETYQKADMQKEAEEIMDRARKLDELTDVQLSIIERLDSKRIYSDILTNFYNTGIIGEMDLFYYRPDVEELTLEDETDYSYFFKLIDVTGDGKDEIAILSKSTNGSGGNLTIYEIVKGKAVEVCRTFHGGNYSTIYGEKYTLDTFILNNNSIVYKYFNEDDRATDIDIYSYNSMVFRFELLPKDSEQRNTAINLMDKNMVKLTVSDIDNAVTPDNIVEAVEDMEVSDIMEDDYALEKSKKNHNNYDSNYKEIYIDILNSYKEKHWYINVTLEDITDDGQEELIIQNIDDEHGANYIVYEVINGKAYKILDCVSKQSFNIFEDNTILDVYYNYDNVSDYFYYVYDKDISRFYLVKSGEYRTGDPEYLNKLLKKPVKLDGTDFITIDSSEDIESLLQ